MRAPHPWKLEFVHMLSHKGGWEPQLICSSYFVYVAMDENGNKCRVPKLIPESKEEEEDLRRCEKKRNKLR